MASQSDSNLNSADDKAKNPASQATEPINEQKVAKGDVPKEKVETSIFVNSEPIREDQVLQAVKFLSHPNVRGSAVIHRRSFLERKGLTKEEIDEAFRRVPDSMPSGTPSQPIVANQDGQLKSSSPIPAQTSTHTLQPAPAATAGSVAKLGTLSRFHWSHAVLAVGILAASGAGIGVLFKKAIIPRLKTWIHKVMLEEEEPLVKKIDQKPNLAEEAAAAAKAAAAAAADVARASQDMLVSKTEEKRYFMELTSLLDVQIREMKSMSNKLQKLEGQSISPGRIPSGEQDGHDVSLINSMRYYTNNKVENGMHPVRSSSPPPLVEPSVASHPKSYMEIMAMVQKGERPSNIREINDQPPNPNQPVPNPRFAPKPKPWEVGYSQNGSSNVFPYEESSNIFKSGLQTTELYGESSSPWWQQKNGRITEIVSEDEVPSGSSMLNEKLAQRSWVPPRVPHVAMAEAAAAIRQPKKPSSQREQLTDDQLLARSSEISSDLETISKMPESGVVDVNVVSPVISASEIQREEEQPHIET